MDISAVNAATSAYSAMNQNSKAAMTNQSGNVAQTTQADSVNLSPEAIASQRQEKYALKDDPIVLFNEWLENDNPRTISFSGIKPYGELLPETQSYIDLLNQRLEQVQTPEQRKQIEAYISGASRFGSNEMIQSDSDLETCWQVEQVSVDLMMAHSQINNEEIGLPDGVKSVNGSSYSELRTLDSIPDQNVSDSEKIALSEGQHSENLEAFYYGWLNGSRTLENEILSRNTLVQNFENLLEK